MNFDAGDRVQTPYGAGTVQYRRMAPPEFSTVAVYSVRLDNRADDPKYTGSIIPAHDVKGLQS